MGASLSLPGARQAGDKGALKAFYAEDGPFDELKQAGYLLAVAFKIDSKIPPGKIEQVKNHKKLIKDLDAIKTAKAGEAVRASPATPRPGMRVRVLPRGASRRRPRTALRVRRSRSTLKASSCRRLATRCTRRSDGGCGVGAIRSWQ